MIAQNAPNTIDSNGMKQGEWTKYNDEGKLIYIGAFADDEPIGTFTYYFENGEKKAELTYKPEDNSVAQAVVYHRNGKVMSRGTYIYKQRHGLWEFFDEDEKLITEEIYDHGVKTGNWKVYYYNGNLNEETTWEDDKKNGAWKQYFTDGTLKVNGTYKNDLLEGETIYYHPDGSVMVRGDYIHNLKNGTWVFFDEEGILVKEQEYKMGRLLEDPEK